MKNIPLVFVGLLMFASCEYKQDRAEMKIKQRMIFELMLENEITSQKIEEDGGKSTRPAIIAFLKRNHELTSWREHYQATQDIPSLIIYSDSVVARYNSLLNETDEDVAQAIKTYRQNTLESSDSASILNLTWYTLYAETAILHHYLYSTASGGDYFDSPFPTTLSDSVVMRGDTVFVHVTSYRALEDRELDFTSISCVNQKTGTKLNTHIIKTGFNYLLRYIPNEKGKYIIRGPVHFLEDDGDDYPIKNKFRVE